MTRAGWLWGGERTSPILPGTGRGTSEAGGGARAVDLAGEVTRHRVVARNEWLVGLASRKPPVPLHHPSGGPPPPLGEDRFVRNRPLAAIASPSEPMTRMRWVADVASKAGVAYFASVAAIRIRPLVATIRAGAKRIGVGAAILFAAGGVTKIAFEMATRILSAIYPAPSYFCRTDCSPMSRSWWLDRGVDATASVWIMAPILILVVGIGIVSAVLFARIYRSFALRRA